MEIGVVGSGHVGLVTGACLAEMGHRVICMDDSEEKIEKLRERLMPFYEPELAELVESVTREGRLSFTTDIEETVKASDVLFICVGTPSKEGGEADLSAVEKASTRIAETMDDYRLVVEKSTVPVQTGGWIRRTMEAANRRGVPFDVACNPEFLREGLAVSDFMHPDRVVIGVESKRAEETLTNLYLPLGAPIIVTDIESAEIIKHASNSFLATKISFINAVSVICEKTGADVLKVAEGMGCDGRIGRQFLDAGVGFGGSCFPKDLKAFSRIAENLGYDFKLLKEVERINQEQRTRLVKKLRAELWNLKGKTVGILGLSYKPDTDDMRSAPAIEIVELLEREGATVRAYDPKAMDTAKKILQKVQYCKDPYETADGSDALVILTEWEEFRGLDLAKIKTLLKKAIVIDGRNLLDPDDLRPLGFVYKGVGR